MFYFLAAIFTLSILVNFVSDFSRKGISNRQWHDNKFWALAFFVAIQFILVIANDPRGLGANFYLMAFITGPLLFLYSIIHALKNLPRLMLGSSEL